MASQLNEPQQLLTTSEVAELLRMGRAKVLDLINAGDLAALNVARVGCSRPRFMVEAAELERWKRSRQQLRYDAGEAKGPRPRRRNADIEQFFK